MTAQDYCLLTAVLLCLSGYLSTTDVTPSQTDKVQLFCQDCSSDGDCSRGDKCCGSVCVSSVSTKPGACPPKTLLGESCARPCACVNKKCCRDGCRHCCIARHAVKSGQCPKPKKIPESVKSCFHDGQCPAAQKCCPTLYSGCTCSDLQGDGPQNN